MSFENFVYLHHLSLHILSYLAPIINFGGKKFQKKKKRKKMARSRERLKTHNNSFNFECDSSLKDLFLLFLLNFFFFSEQILSLPPPLIHLVLCLRLYFSLKGKWFCFQTSQRPSYTPDIFTIVHECGQLKVTPCMVAIIEQIGYGYI